ncbi:hypothetical protein [Azospirillum sp. SYSU D00513]|uniref:hypothetical protein n=1 Tax=Azospirillum sp. SYSU D00513 TaxID=2812561 RepID=UPI001A9707F9|nr:hypothetical protein [Azospirillum sp. SYSU D00513]
MMRLLAPAFAAVLLTACATDAPPEVAEVQCRNFAQSASSDDFSNYTRQRVEEDLEMTSSPMMYEDIHDRVCD